MRLRDLAGLALLTIRSPEAAWPRLRALNLSMNDRWLGMAGLVAISTLIGWALTALFPLPPAPEPNIIDQITRLLRESPLYMAALQFAGMVVAAALLAFVGQRFGGRASFADALLAVLWMEAIMLAVQIVQLGIMLALPFLAPITRLMELVLYLYLSVRLTQVIHGFRNPALVAIGMFGTIFAAAMVMALVLVLLGFAPPQGVAP